MKKKNIKYTKEEIGGPAESREKRNAPPIPGEEPQPQEGEIRKVEKDNLDSNKTRSKSVNHSAEDDGVIY